MQPTMIVNPAADDAPIIMIVVSLSKGAGLGGVGEDDGIRTKVGPTEDSVSEIMVSPETERCMAVSFKLALYSCIKRLPTYMHASNEPCTYTLAGSSL